MELQGLIAEYRRRQNMGQIFIISGPSGAGKTLLCKEIQNVFPRLSCSISYTTRSRRPQEVDGRDYFFISEEEFRRKISGDDFLEWAVVHGARYGTCRRWVQERLAGGEDVLLEIDVQGAKQVRSRDISSCSVFVVPPSMEVLRERLLNRKRDARVDIDRRLRNAADEIQCVYQYQYVIVNDDLKDAIARLAAVIRAQKCLLAGG